MAGTIEATITKHRGCVCQDFEDSGMQAFVDWRVDWPNDATTAGFEHCDVTTDPFEISSLDATRAAARQAVLRAHLALLRNCGAPGRLRCLDAERIQERIFHGAFD